RRFCDELANPALALPDQPDKIGYIVIDGRLARQFSAWPHFVSTAPGVAYAYVPDYRRNRPDVYTQAAAVAELARKLEMDGAALAGSLRRENQAPAGAPLTEPPFIALGPVRSVFVHN